ncbi:hypothetical protein BPUN_0549 [Candidatus Paraburkholderia kirkii]|nr:hypothetical protein BPUN_0549 [Candidatus Paraburkholderia kirkii]
MAEVIVVASCLLTACGGSSDSGSTNLPPSARAAALGENLIVRVEIDTNDAAKSGTNCTDLGAERASCARGKLVLENHRRPQPHRRRLDALFAQHPAHPDDRASGLRVKAHHGRSLRAHAARRHLHAGCGRARRSAVRRRILVSALQRSVAARVRRGGRQRDARHPRAQRYRRRNPLRRPHSAGHGQRRGVCRDARASAARPRRSRTPSPRQSAARALPAVLRETAGEGALQVGGIDLSLSVTSRAE